MYRLVAQSLVGIPLSGVCHILIIENIVPPTTVGGGRLIAIPSQRLLIFQYVIDEHTRGDPRDFTSEKQKRKKKNARAYHMWRRGGLPQCEQFCLLSLSFKGRDCDRQVGVTDPRRYLQSRRASCCLPATDGLSFT